MTSPGQAVAVPAAGRAGVSLVIPVYNEGENIARTLADLKAKVHRSYEALVVYDFEEDTTVPVVRARAVEFPEARLVKNAFGRGALNAIRTGFAEARGEYVVVVMADMADDVAAINAMIEKADAGFDLVCGSRYMPGGAQIGGPRLKRTLSRLAGLTLHHFARIPTRDATNSFKLYRRELLRAIPVESDGGFELGLELVVKAHLGGWRVTEVPSVWRDRTAGESRFQLTKWLPKYLRWYMKAFFGRRARRPAAR